MQTGEKVDQKNELGMRLEFVGYLKIDPQLNPSRDDPRFAALLKKSGFPSEA
jgi:hypothetical protein